MPMAGANPRYSYSQSLNVRVDDEMAEYIDRIAVRYFRGRRSDALRAIIGKSMIDCPDASDFEGVVSRYNSV